jgi:hypothetical protein
MAEYCLRKGKDVEACPLTEIKSHLAPSLPCNGCKKDRAVDDSGGAYHSLSECAKSCLLLNEFNRKVEETTYNHDCISCELYPHQ